ncbi:hypothetical protein AB5N19_11696 [Seiridium cardinale]|uniref:Uncharacterized protein n=1 Tax=Seiridium cardinale TaxID=138064 RepID=A0ABR2XEC4_9PEZI
MQDQPLSHWTFFITLNATVALFITASKVAAMFTLLRDLDLFEEASRGPLGALHLLSSARFKLSFMVMIGLLATVLALGIDTFGQLVVDLTGSRDVEVDDGQASFGLSHIYNSGVQGQLGGEGGGFMPITSTIDTSMQGAIYKALYGVKSQAIFNCTSRCVWKGNYISLGFGSDCSDVTAETQATIKPNANRTHSGQHWWDMTTPGNIALSAGYSQTSWLTLANVVAVDLLAKFKYGSPIDNISISPEFIQIAVLIGPVDNVNGYVQDTYPDGWKVYECTVGVTAYNYSDISASGNELNIGRIDRIPLTSGTLHETILTFSQAALPNMTIQGIDLEALNDFFTSSRFSGYTFSGEEPPNSTTGMGAVMRNTDLPTLFQQMAESMTDQLRSGYNDTASGLTVGSVVFVRVHWQWLSLPFFILAAALLLLIHTIIRSNSDAKPLWKSSVTAILFHEVVPEGGLEGVMRTDVQSLDQLKNLTRRNRAILGD